MSLIHLLSLLSSAFLAGLVSLTTEEENIPLERSPWRVNTKIFVDDGYFGSVSDIYGGELRLFGKHSITDLMRHGTKYPFKHYRPTLCEGNT